MSTAAHSLAWLNLQLILNDANGHPAREDKRDALFYAANVMADSELPEEFVAFISRMLREYAEQQPASKGGAPRRVGRADAYRIRLLMMLTGETENENRCAKLLRAYYQETWPDLPIPGVSALTKNYNKMEDRVTPCLTDDVVQFITERKSTGDEFLDDLYYNALYLDHLAEWARLHPLE